MSGKASKRKSARKSAPGKPFEKGKDPRRGRGPKPGEGGRPPNEFKRHMQALTSQKNVEAYLRKCLRGEFGPKFFMAALQYTTDRGYGKAAQPHEHSGADGESLEVTVTHRIVDVGDS